MSILHEYIDLYIEPLESGDKSYVYEFLNILSMAIVPGCSLEGYQRHVFDSFVIRVCQGKFSKTIQSELQRELFALQIASWANGAHVANSK
jgi:hypothetical protein